MQSLVNSVQLIGRLGTNGEVKTTTTGIKVSNVSLATNEFYKNSNGEWVQNTNWHKLVFWGKLAERLEKSTKKGSRIAIKGSLIQRSYKDSNDIERDISEVKVSEFMILENMPSENEA